MSLYGLTWLTLKGHYFIMLDSIISYYRGTMLHVPFAETLEQAPEWRCDYDIETWRDGESWGLEAQHISPAAAAPSPSEGVGEAPSPEESA